MSATIVSFVPYLIRERKPTVIPEEYVIKPSDGKTPSVLVIKSAMTTLYRGYDQPNFPFPVPAEELAEDIIKSFVTTQLEYAEDAKPALFWVTGEFNAATILKEFPEKVVDAKAKQNRWFMRLIKKADDDWAQHKQHKLVTDIQRLAAKQLGLHSKEWLVMPDPVEMVKCPACFSYIEQGTVKCKFCGAILDMKRASELGLISTSTTQNIAASK